MQKLYRRLHNYITMSLKIFHFKINLWNKRSKDIYVYFYVKKKRRIIEIIIHCQMQINNMINIIYKLNFYFKMKFPV